MRRLMVVFVFWDVMMALIGVRLVCESVHLTFGLADACVLEIFMLGPILQLLEFSVIIIVYGSHAETIPIFKPSGRHHR